MPPAVATELRAGETVARFRVLRSSFDREAYRHTVQSIQTHSPFVRDQAARNAAAREAPRAVHVAEEGEATVSELAARLRAGTIAPTDLVNLTGHWETFAECMSFDEITEPLRQRAKWKRRLLMGAASAVSISSLLWLFWKLATL